MNDQTIKTYPHITAPAPVVSENQPPLENCDSVATEWHSTVAQIATYDPHKEQLVVFLLNTHQQIIGWNLVSVGTVNETVAHPREIFRPAIAGGATNIILAHNHPSGDVSPSAPDRQMTRRIRDAGELLSIRLLDHVIVCADVEKCFSFAESGLI